MSFGRRKARVDLCEACEHFSLAEQHNRGYCKMLDQVLPRSNEACGFFRVRGENEVGENISEDFQD